MGSKRQAEMVNITKMKVCGPVNVIDVRLKSKSTVEDDTQTLNLWGGGN